MKQTIGFIGLGMMGRGMAINLLRAGYEITVNNRTLSKAEELREQGAKVAATPKDAAKGNDVVITMLADPAAVNEAVIGKNGIIEGLEKGSVLIDCSTVDPTTTKATLAAATEKGADFLDSPVGGSKDAALAGELILMVGGDREALDRVRAILEVLSSKIIHAGPSGSGTMTKLCFNLIMSHMVAGLSEALVLGVSGGLNPETIIEAIMSGGIASRYYEWKGGAIMNRDFAANFPTRLMHKDLNLIMSAGYSLDIPLPISAAIKELFSMAEGHGQSDEDFCSVVKVLEDLAGVEVRK